MTAPYANGARVSHRNGWSPLPLPPGRKKPPPTGWTGYAAPMASGADVQAWVEDRPTANLGLRTPETVLGLDLDAYDGKPGLSTMLAAVERLGALPQTVRSTSRADDDVSGIRLYRVPPGRCWADELGPGVEVIHYGHRYVVAAPSVHPEGREYRWYGPDGEPLSEPPAVDELPDLPLAWVAALDAGSVADRAGKADITRHDVREWLANMPAGEPCSYVLRLVDEAATELSTAASRHNVARTFVGRLVRAGDQGHRGAVVGLDTLHGMFLSALQQGKPREADPGEWARLVTGAVALAVKDPTSALDKGCCGVEAAAGPPGPPVDNFQDHQSADEAELRALERAAAFAREVDLEAYKIRVREGARGKVAAEESAATVLPSLTRLDAFLSVTDDDATYRIAPLWPTGGRVVLSAPHKLGKSTLGGNLVRSLVDAEPFLDAFAVTAAGRVVIIDNELDERMLRRWLRAQDIRNGARVEVLALRGRLSTFNILHAATRSRWAQHLGAADVVVFDCLRPALDALGLSEDKDAGKFLEAFDELTNEAGVSESLIVHHMGHQGERSRGDSRILDWPDAVWKLVRDAEDDEASQGDIRRYFSAYGRDVDHPETLLAFDPVNRHLSVAGGSRRDRKVDEARDAVLDTMAAYGAAMSGRAIEERLRDTGPGRATIRAALKRAVKDGDVLVSTGARNATMHTLNPSSAPVRRSAPPVRQRTESECASAPIGRTHAHSHNGDLAETTEPAHSAPGPEVLDRAAELLREHLGAGPTHGAAPYDTPPLEVARTDGGDQPLDDSTTDTDLPSVSGDGQCPGCPANLGDAPAPRCDCPGLHEQEVLA